MCLCWNKQTLHGLFRKKVVLQFCSISYITHVFSLYTRPINIIFMVEKTSATIRSTFILIDCDIGEIECRVRVSQRSKQRTSGTTFVVSSVNGLNPWGHGRITFPAVFRTVFTELSSDSPRSGYYERKHSVYHSYT